MSTFRGKVVLVNFWATWCGPCQVEMPQLQKIYAELGAKGVQIIGVSTDEAKLDVAVKPLVRSKGLTYPILRDESGVVGKAYGATNTPQMVVIDPTGTVRYAGAIDNAPDGEGRTPAGGTLVNWVDQALADLAAGRPVATPATKPYGCGVKYAQ